MNARDHKSMPALPPLRFGPMLLFGAALAGLAGPSTAQAGADVERFRAPMTVTGLIGTDTTQPLYPMQLSAAAVLGFSRDPVVWRYPDGTYDPVVGQRLTLDLVAAAGLLPLVDVAVALPIALQQSAPPEAGLGDLRGAGVGDLRLMPRVQLLPERSFGIGLAVIPELTLPTGDEGRFLGDPTVSFRPRIAASLPLGPARVVASLGYHLRRNAAVAGVTLGDQVDYRAGAERELSDFGVPMSALVELAGSTAAARPFAGEGADALELLGAVRVVAFSPIAVILGGGVGLTRGVGTPAYRLLLGVAWAPVAVDTDGDGIPDLADACPEEPEDFDGFADIDGCPDLDNDEDGIPDLQDGCPNEPETKNGFEDGDGCPDADRADQDHDGIPDAEDRCPTEPEDSDNFEDADGCPDPDHDHDGIPDHVDECPEEKETINGIDDYDGCPDEGEGLTEYIEEVRIDIRETILFESGKATIKTQSKRVLDQVALQILAHPEIPHIRIEGHTDSLGSEEENLYLSQDRADAVRLYLISRGVRAEILEAVGYGELRPIDTNATPEGRSRNRRVEFMITQGS